MSESKQSYSNSNTNSDEQTREQFGPMEEGNPSAIPSGSAGEKEGSMGEAPLSGPKESHHRTEGESHHHHHHHHSGQSHHRHHKETAYKSSPFAGSRRHRAKEGKGQKPFVIVLELLFILAVVAGIIFFARKMDSGMNEKAVDSDDFYANSNKTGYQKGVLLYQYLPYYFFHSYENYLFMGTDNSGLDVSDEKEYENSMADFLLLLSIDKSMDTYSLIELNRDTIVNVPMIDHKGESKGSSFQHLCTAHWYGGTPEMGCENTVTTVSEMLGGLPIDGYYSMYMEDMPKLNKALGGVTVTIEDDFSGIDPEMVPGKTLTLSDEQAYLFVRSRINVGDGTNLSRMRRQHAYLEGMLEKAGQGLKGNINFYYNLFDTLNSFATTNLSGKQISKIAKALTQNTSRGLHAFDGKLEIGTNRLGDGLEHYEYFLLKSSRLEIMNELFDLTPHFSEEEGLYNASIGSDYLNYTPEDLEIYSVEWDEYQVRLEAELLGEEYVPGYEGYIVEDNAEIEKVKITDEESES